MRADLTSRTGQFYIDGAWVAPAAGRPFTIINPATEKPLTEVLLGDERDADCAVEAAVRAFPSWSVSRVGQRIELLERIVTELAARAEDLAQAQSLTMGSPISAARTGQTEGTLDYARALISALRQFTFSWLETTTLIRKEAIGVCGLISPWNWPLGQSVQKVFAAIAAGCTMVLKPSELTPLDAILLSEAIDLAGTPAGVFNLVQGEGPVVGARLASHPEVAMVSITGSTLAGADVARTAAATVKRVVQELGGKSANILLPDCDLTAAVPAGVRTAFRNCGQSCSAPTRMLVPAQAYDEVADLARQTATAIVVGDPADERTELGPVANERQFSKVQQLIQAGLDDGADLITGGPGRPVGLPTGYYCRPTVFGVSDPDAQIARTEIFGPVLCIQPYHDVDDAVRVANCTDYGLGGYVQGRDLDMARAVAVRMRTGTVNINSAPVDPSAPFGGYKHSGNGRERGHFGIDDYLEIKSIVGYAEGACGDER